MVQRWEKVLETPRGQCGWSRMSRGMRLGDEVKGVSGAIAVWVLRAVVGTPALFGGFDQRIDVI